MSINNNTLSDEIELGKYLNLFWKGKFIIIGHILALLCIIAIYKYFSPPPIINFNTQVKPITSLETEYYNISNKIGLIKIFPSRDNIKEDISEESLDENKKIRNALIANRVINKDVLLEEFIENSIKISKNYGFVDEKIILDELFFETIDREDIFNHALKKYEILDKNNFPTEMDYDKAISSLVSSIKITEPAKLEILPNGVTKRAGQKFWEINFSHHDAEKWMDILEEVNTKANNQLKNSLIRIFNERILLYEKTRSIEINRINEKIKNIRRVYHENRKTNIAVLTEKLAILNVINTEKNKNTNINEFVTGLNLVTEGDYRKVVKELSNFFAGPLPVEKQLNLLKTRKNHDAFIIGLSEEKKLLNSFKNDKISEYAKEAFYSSPIGKDNFYGMKIHFDRTKSTKSNYNKLLIFTTLIFGFIFGIFHVIIYDQIVKRD